MESKNQEELFFQLNMFEQQIQQLQQQLHAVEQGIIELNFLNTGLDELVGSGPSKMGEDSNESSEGKEILAPIGKGIFVNAKLLSEELIVNIGGGNFVKKSILETKKILEGQIKKLEQVKDELEKNLEQLGEEVRNIMGQAESTHKHCYCKEGEECNCEKDCECGE